MQLPTNIANCIQTIQNSGCGTVCFIPGNISLYSLINKAQLSLIEHRAALPVRCVAIARYLCIKTAFEQYQSLHTAIAALRIPSAGRLPTGNGRNGPKTTRGLTPTPVFFRPHFQTSQGVFPGGDSVHQGAVSLIYPSSELNPAPGRRNAARTRLLGRTVRECVGVRRLDGAMWRD